VSAPGKSLTGKVEIGRPSEPAERKWEVESPLSKREVVAMRSEAACPDLVLGGLWRRRYFVDRFQRDGHVIVPLRKALPPAEPSPTLISENVAVGLMRELLAQMREIAEEMKGIARSKWK